MTTDKIKPRRSGTEYQRLQAERERTAGELKRLRTYLEDEVKYRLLCEESFSLARQFSWKEPVLEYYKNLVA